MNGKKISGLIVISFLFSSVWSSYAQELQNVLVTKVYGRVEVQTIGEVLWKKVAAGMKLGINDRIRTFEKAMVVITFDDATATIGENSIMDILELKKSTLTQAINLKFKLWIGKLRAQVKELKNFESDFKVITPCAVIGIRGTKWGTFVDQDGTTKVIVEEGEIWVQNLPGTQRYLVKQNQKTIVTPDKVVKVPQKITTKEKDEYLKNWQEPIVKKPPKKKPKKEEKPPIKKLEPKEPEKEKKHFSLTGVVGSRMIDGVNYNELILQPEFRKGKFGIGLNLLARWNDKDGFRDEDWDEIGNIVNYVRWAHKRDKPIYIYLGKLNATLGHGFIVDRYSNQGTDTSKGILGSILDINLRYGGLETLVNDATDPRLYGGRIYFMPLKNMDMPLLNKIIIGATYVNDKEPQQGNKNDLTVYGVDFELPIYGKVLALHGDYAKIKDFGDGIALGLGGKLSITRFATLGYKTELRDLDDKFVPGVFNPLYEVARRGIETIQEAKSQKGWYVGADLDIAKLILLSGGYEDLRETEAPRIHLAASLKQKLFQLLTRQNISISWTYDHERKGKEAHLIDFNAPNSTITGKINFKILKNLSLSYIHQKVYDKEGKKTETSSLSTQVLF
jgi:hypothetical protein